MAEKENLSADALPKAVGPYQHAVEYGGIIYMSAQLPIDAETNELVPGDIRAQTRKVMENLCTLLEGCGSSLAKILACRVYITDMSLFSDVNAVGPLGGNDFVISIHAPRVGSDAKRKERIRRKIKISIHAPRVGSDTRYTQINTCKFAHFTQFLSAYIKC